MSDTTEKSFSYNLLVSLILIEMMDIITITTILIINERLDSENRITDSFHAIKIDFFRKSL